MHSTRSAIFKYLSVFGLTLAVIAASGCRLFERELNSWEPPPEGDESDFVTLSGSVHVETRTTGNHPDHNGYTIWYEQGTRSPIGANGTVVVDGVQWRLGENPRWFLGEVAPHCRVSGGFRDPQRPDIWSLGRWFLTPDAITERRVDVVCEISG